MSPKIKKLTPSVQIHATVLDRNINMNPVVMLLLETLTLTKTERLLSSLKRDQNIPLQRKLIGPNDVIQKSLHAYCKNGSKKKFRINPVRKALTNI